MARRFDGLLIDFYGTISTGDRDVVEAVCKKIVSDCELRLTPLELTVRWGEEFFGLLGRSNRENFRTLYECERISLSETLDKLGAARADVGPYISELEEYWANPPVHADALEFLRKVRIPTCCVSNADTRPLHAAIERHGLRFDGIITSELAGCYKPDPAIFHKALSLLNLRPERVMHVGDSLHSDISGAQNAGISAAWIHRASRIHDIGKRTPELTVTSLPDLLPVLL